MEFKPANLRFRLNKGKRLDLIEKTPFLPSKFLSLTIGLCCIQFFLPHLICRKLSFFLHFLMEFKPANLRFRLNAKQKFAFGWKKAVSLSKWLFSLQIAADRVHFSLQRLTKHKLSLYFKQEKPSFISQMTTMPPAYYLKRWNSKIFARAFTAEINHSKLA